MLTALTLTLLPAPAGGWPIVGLHWHVQSHRREHRASARAAGRNVAVVGAAGRAAMLAGLLAALLVKAAVWLRLAPCGGGGHRRNHGASAHDAG